MSAVSAAPSVAIEFDRLSFAGRNRRAARICFAILGLLVFTTPDTLPAIRLATESGSTFATSAVPARLPVLLVPGVGFPSLGVPKLPTAQTTPARGKGAAATQAAHHPLAKTQQVRVPVVKDTFIVTPPAKKKKKKLKPITTNLGAAPVVNVVDTIGAVPITSASTSPSAAAAPPAAAPPSAPPADGSLPAPPDATVTGESSASVGPPDVRAPSASSQASVDPGAADLADGSTVPSVPSASDRSFRFFDYTPATTADTITSGSGSTSGSASGAATLGSDSLTSSSSAPPATIQPPAVHPAPPIVVPSLSLSAPDAAVPTTGGNQTLGLAPGEITGPSDPVGVTSTQGGDGSSTSATLSGPADNQQNSATTPQSGSSGGGASQDSTPSSGAGSPGNGGDAAQPVDGASSPADPATVAESGRSPPAAWIVRLANGGTHTATISVDGGNVVVTVDGVAQTRALTSFTGL